MSFRNTISFRTAFVLSKPFNLVIQGQGCYCREQVCTNAKGSGSDLVIIKIVCPAFQVLFCILRLPLCAIANAIAGRGERATCSGLEKPPRSRTAGEAAAAAFPRPSASPRLANRQQQRVGGIAHVLREAPGKASGFRGGDRAEALRCPGGIILSRGVTPWGKVQRGSAHPRSGCGRFATAHVPGAALVGYVCVPSAGNSIKGSRSLQACPAGRAPS